MLNNGKYQGRTELLNAAQRLARHRHLVPSPVATHVVLVNLYNFTLINPGLRRVGDTSISVNEVLIASY